MPKELDVTLKVTLPAGNPYQGDYSLRLGDCTGRDDLDVRRETGLSLVGLMEQTTDDKGLALVVVATVLWLVRRKQFAHMTFDDALNSLHWGDDFDLDVTSSDGSEIDPGKVQDSGKPVLAPEPSRLSHTGLGYDRGKLTT